MHSGNEWVGRNEGRAQEAHKDAGDCVTSEPRSYTSRMTTMSKMISGIVLPRWAASGELVESRQSVSAASVRIVMRIVGAGTTAIKDLYIFLVEANFTTS